MLTVVKFTDFQNSKLDFSTRTMGKIGVPTFTDDLSIGFWLVEIIKESHRLEPKGVFFLKPMHPIEKVDSLLPSFYTKEIINRICYVTPKFKDKFYIIPLKIKKLIFEQNPEIYAIIVDHSEDIVLI